jgi:hypothetical protein
MHRIVPLLLLGWVLVVPDLAAQQGSPPPRVRVVTGAGDAPLVGQHVATVGDTLVLVIPGEPEVRRVPLAEVHALAYWSARGTYAERGAILGAGLGALALGAWMFVDESSSDTCRTDCVYVNPARVPMTLLGVVAGGLGGGYLGRRLGDRVARGVWEELDPGRIGLLLSPNGVALVLRREPR